MKTVELKAFKREAETWMRTLRLLQAENVALKHRLADVISNGINGELLPSLEYYHNFFIEEDRVLLLFYNDIKNQEQLLLRSCLEEKEPALKVMQQQEKIRREMSKVETVFYKKKQGFARLIEGRN